MAEYAKIKAIDDARDSVHARRVGTRIDRTECGLTTVGMLADGEVNCIDCKRAIGL